MSTDTETQAPPRRDVRVDQIGFCKELERRHADTLIAAVKLKMAAEVVERVEGDYFTGLLVGGTVRTVDPAALLKLLTKEKITVAQFLSAISVQIKPATPKLVVARKKGVEILLVDALKGLGTAIGEGKA